MSYALHFLAKPVKDCSHCIVGLRMTTKSFLAAISTDRGEGLYLLRFWLLVFFKSAVLELLRNKNADWQLSDKR